MGLLTILSVRRAIGRDKKGMKSTVEVWAPVKAQGFEIYYNIDQSNARGVSMQLSVVCMSPRDMGP